MLLVGLGPDAHRQPSSPRGTVPLATGLETPGDSAGKISMCVCLKQSLFSPPLGRPEIPYLPGSLAAMCAHAHPLRPAGRGRSHLHDSRDGL